MKKARKKKEMIHPETTAQEILRKDGIVIRYITDHMQAEEAVGLIFLNFDMILGLDIETAKLPPFESHERAGLNPHLSRIRLIQICTAREVFVFDIDLIGLKPLEPLWLLPMVAHNAVFDLKHLIHAGINPPDIDCTMLLANAITGGLPSLENLAFDRLGLSISKDLQTSDWNATDLSEDQIAYAALDAILTYWLFHDLMEKIYVNERQIYKLMKDSLKAVAKLELNGFNFNTSEHVILMADWEQKKALAETDVRLLMGPEINLNSPKQLSQWLSNRLDSQTLKVWPTTETGQLKTDANTLAQYPDNPIVEPLLKYKEITKLLSTYGESFAAHVNPVTGRIHANFRIAGAATGRFTCGSPNVQNPPIDKAFRSLFTAPPGKFLIVGDYNQIELRVAALISRDQSLLDAYARGEDLHTKTAAAIAGIPVDQVTKQQRQAAKAVNFGMLFGQGAKGLMRYAKANYGVEMTEEEANNARKVFFTTYSRLATWQRLNSSDMHAKTPTGRLRDFRKEGLVHCYTEVLNTPIQGGAAEVLLSALSILDNYLEGIDAKLVNIVHDEIVVESSEEALGEAMVAVEKAMIEGVLAIFPEASINNLVELKIGNNWAEAK